MPIRRRRSAWVWLRAVFDRVEVSSTKRRCVAATSCEGSVKSSRLAGESTINKGEAPFVSGAV